MKVALLISGLFRTFPQCIEKTLAVFKDYEVNVFGSFWDEVGHSSKYYDGALMEDLWTSEDLKIVESKLSHVPFATLEMEPLSVIYDEIESIRREKRYIISLTYKIHRVIKLCRECETQHQIRHDWYVRLRPDASIVRIPPLMTISSRMTFVNMFSYMQPSSLSYEKSMCDGVLITNDPNWISFWQDKMKMSNLVNMLIPVSIDIEAVFAYIICHYLKVPYRLFHYRLTVLRATGNIQEWGTFPDW